MKMLGARGREGIKRYGRRNERFLRNEIQYFQEIIQTTFQKCGDIHEPPNRANPWEGDGWQATEEEARPKDEAPSRKQ